MLTSPVRMSHFTFASVGVSWTQLVSIFTQKERSGSLANVLLDVDPFYLMEGVDSCWEIRRVLTAI